MSWTIPFALAAWIPLVALAFVVLPPARAALVTYLAGWMFLPVPGIEVLGFDYGKQTAVPLVVFAAIAVCDGVRLASFRPGLVDLPIALFCVAPIVSSLANQLGAYDALTGGLYQAITWGLPYLTGRLYFSTPDGLRQLARGIFAAGLVYAPLCLWEIRMSPQLHTWAYGMHQHEWVQTLRAGGFRPVVFMQHGLMVGLWMCAASVVGLALWSSGAVRRFWGIPMALLVPALFATTFLGHSFGAIVLLAVGTLLLLSVRVVRSSLPMALVLLMPAAYVGARLIGTRATSRIVELVESVSIDRAHSLAFRIDAEERLRVRAAEAPVFGWGGFGRSMARQFDDPLRKETVTIDSLWILVLGKQGLAGLVSLLLVLAVPALVLWRKCPPARGSEPSAAPAWALALVLALFALDCLVNAMTNPVYVLIAGGLCGLAPAAARVHAPSTARRQFAGVHAP